MIDRPRPDGLMWGKKWAQIISASGKDYASVIDVKIDEHNNDPDEITHFNDFERAFMRLYPRFQAASIETLEYHWQQHKPPESALPLKVWNIPDLHPDTKPDRKTLGPVWKQIRAPGKEALKEILHMWLLREIYTFVRNFKDYQRKNPKKEIKMKTQCKGRVGDRQSPEWICQSPVHLICVWGLTAS